MSVVVADTHALLWFLADPARLSKPALDALRAAAAVDGIRVSSISIIELVYLTEEGKLPTTALDRVRAALASGGQGLTLAAVDDGVAWKLGQGPRDQVPDMPDRIVAATALALGVPVVSKDARIRSSAVQTIW
jgi:PIN domain nuclease of toxin-antitoxin system